MTTQSNLPTNQHPERQKAKWSALGPLPKGPLDLVGDIHGEPSALESLLDQLGYHANGDHPEKRHLVFLGDLIDRGPDSPGVVRRVAELVDRGLAMTIMGNHDLNAIQGKQKKENTWLFHHGPVSDYEKSVMTERERDEILEFLRQQPLARQRADLRVVHACWDDAALCRLVDAQDPVEAFENHRIRIESTLANDTDPVARNLALQNQNPVKLVTSGPETRAPKPYFAGGKMRSESRKPWWDEYRDDPFVVFGHYWRIPIPAIQKDDGLFSGQPLNSALGVGKAICIDYSVGGRYCDRLEGRIDGPFIGRLAALRWPECELVFDDGERHPMTTPRSLPAEPSA